MKTLLKTIFALIIGMAVGLTLAVAGITLFTDQTLAGFFEKMRQADLAGMGLAVAVALVGFFVSVALLIVIHEAGHLVCGLASGYKFVSFRVFNLTIIKSGGRLRVKRYAIAGTGGQCLLTPPDEPLEQIPTTLYNAGGVLANIAVGLATLPLLWVDGGIYLHEAVLIFLLTDAFMILANGIPMQLGGVGNDAYNILLLRKNPAAKRAILLQLRSNALVQGGVRPMDMPDQWFAVPDKVDYCNALEVSAPIMAASRLLDSMDYDGALAMFADLYARRDKIMPLYVKEIACELAFLMLIAGQTAEAENLLDKDLRKYITAYSGVMSSKVRLTCAMTLHLDKDPARARQILADLRRDKDKYLLQGEVKSDLALMEAMFVPENA